MKKVIVNGKATELGSGLLLPALRKAGFPVPAVCWHPDVKKSGGRCRVCVCKVNDKLATSCNVQVEEGATYDTDSQEILNLRRAASCLAKFDDAEMNEVLDRPRDLEPQPDPQKTGGMTLPPALASLGEGAQQYVLRNPELCVHCRLCIKVCEEQGVGAVADVRNWDNDGHGMVKPFRGSPLTSTECISCGQCINVCPTGALYEKSEIPQVEAALADPKRVTVVQFAPAVRVALAEEFGCKPGSRQLEREMVAAMRKLGKNIYVFDTNFAADLTIIEEAHELLERLRRTLTGKRKYGGDHMELTVPMITSCSPGWVMFCEKFYHDLLPNLSSCKSPMEMSGAITKHYWCKNLGLQAKEVESIAIMPCIAKKLEKDRKEFKDGDVPDVDHVLTTREFAVMLKAHNVDPTQLEGEDFDNPYGMASGAGLIFGATGGVMEAALRTAYEVISGRDIPFRHLNVSPVRGMDGVKEAALELKDLLPEYEWLEGVTLKVAVVHGTGNARKLMDRLRHAKENDLPAPYHFVEVMACPGGCLGGGGQPKPTSMEIKKQRASLIYNTDAQKPVRKSHENPAVQELYKQFLGEPLGHESHRLLHTSYTPRDSEAFQFLETAEAKEVAKWIEGYPKTRVGLTNLLADVTDRAGALSDEAVTAIAHHVGTTPGMLDAVISHYHFFPRVSKDFDVAPDGTRLSKHSADRTVPPETAVYICSCSHCRRKGSKDVRHAIRDAIKDDHAVTLHEASWLGWCVNGAPAALVKHKGSDKVHQLLNLSTTDARIAPAELKKVNDPVQGLDFVVLGGDRLVPAGQLQPTRPSLLRNIQGMSPPPADSPIKCPVSAKAYAMTSDELIKEIKISGLRGCGGAGFPTHIKWKAVRDEKCLEDNGPDGKVVVVNADEGLPNTFKDYYLLHDPGCRMRMIVGMCLGAHTVGAGSCFLYLRYEYRNLKKDLEAAFEKYTQEINPLVKDLRFYVILGGGPYICGEETALFESIEGQLPQARTERTIYPTHHGLFGKPTLVGNVETFSWITQIAAHGGQAFADCGVNGQSGLKLFSVSGDVTKPVLAEFPMGTPLRRVVDQCAGIPLDEVEAVEVGGFTEVLRYPHEFDKPLALDGKPDHLAAGGSVVVFRKGFNEGEIYQAKAKFSEAESCQLCAPCREGTRMLRRSMQALRQGTLHPSQEALVSRVVDAMEITSNCGHGRAFGQLARDVMRKAKERRDKETNDGNKQPPSKIALWLPRPAGILNEKH